MMSTRSVITAQMTKIVGELGKNSPPLTDDLFLIDSGLDSISMAILVFRLEEALGKNPFTEDFVPPLTLGDLVQLYEKSPG
jgi:acyl carrier protein